MSEAVNNGDIIQLDLYHVDDDTQNMVKGHLYRILDRYGYAEIILPIFTCVNELIVNAVKANFKYIYFENFYLDHTKDKDWRTAIPYSKVLELFRLELKTNGAAHLARIARQKEIKSTIRIHVTQDLTMNVVVTNPHPMTDIEQTNVRNRLEAVKKIQTLSDYFLINEGEAMYEGAGLGLVFVGLVLKSLNLSTDNLMIETQGDHTVATVHFPLNESMLEAYREMMRSEMSGDFSLK
jgi:hypothetical protein